MDLEELEKRIKKLEDREAIKELKAKYTYALDKGDWDTVLGCFTDDAKCDWGKFAGAIYEGKEQLGKFFREDLRKTLSFHAHLVHNPIVEVDGDKARGKWYYEEPCIWTDKDEAGWIMGIYNEEYVKIDNEWKINSIKVEHFYQTTYDKGWAKERMRGS